MKNLPRIYLDMDGVLFDFVKNIEKTTGLTITQWTKLGRKERWDPIIAKKNFWSDGPWLAEGKKLFAFVKKYKPHILSASSEANSNSTGRGLIFVVHVSVLPLSQSVMIDISNTADLLGSKCVVSISKNVVAFAVVKFPISLLRIHLSQSLDLRLNPYSHRYCNHY